MVHYVFPQSYITQKGSHGKDPVKTCCVSDDLSGDMLAPSWPNLVLCLNIFIVPAAVSSFNKTSATLNSVTVTWGHGSGSRNMYTISWEGPVNGKMENIAGTDTSKAITGLTAQGSYTFSILAVSGTKESSPVTIDVTLPGKSF